MNSVYIRAVSDDNRQRILICLTGAGDIIVYFRKENSIVKSILSSLGYKIVPNRITELIMKKKLSSELHAAVKQILNNH